MCAPLWLPPREGAHEQVIGLIYADTQDFERAFDEDDLQILTAFANIAASKIENTKLFAENAEKQRLEGEMRTAAEIQRSILPRDAPRVPGCELYGESRSCESVGGDYHDFHWNGRALSFAVADVSGKGLGAAMLMAALRAAVHAHWQDPALDEAATRINATFFENVPSDRYATCFLGRFDPMSAAPHVHRRGTRRRCSSTRTATDSLHEGGPGHRPVRGRRVHAGRAHAHARRHAARLLGRRERVVARRPAGRGRPRRARARLRRRARRGALPGDPRRRRTPPAACAPTTAPWSFCAGHPRAPRRTTAITGSFEKTPGRPGTPVRDLTSPDLVLPRVLAFLSSARFR